MPTRSLQHLGDGGQAVGRARGVRDDLVVARQLLVVDAIDDGEVGALRRRRDEHALGAGSQMHLRLVLVGEDARAFHDDVDAEVLPRQLGRILFGQHLDRRAEADVDGIAGDLHLAGESAVYAVVLKKMRVVLGRHQVVDGDELQVGALCLGGGTQHVSADAAKARDRNLHCHRRRLLGAFLLRIRSVLCTKARPLTGRGASGVNAASHGVLNDGRKRQHKIV